MSQAYLRRFADGKEILFAYDKPTGRSFRQSVSKVGYEKFFYDFPSEAVEKAKAEAPDEETRNSLEPQLVEKLLGGVDASFNDVVNQVIQSVEASRRLTPALHEAPAWHTAIQSARTLQFREDYFSLIELGTQAVIDRVAGGRGYVAKYSREYAALEHARILLSDSFIGPIAAALRSHILIVGRSRSGIGFYTSDEPVTVHAHVREAHHSHSGFASRGVEVLFQLSTWHVARFFERTHHGKLAALEGRSVPLIEQNVVWMNHHQLCSSRRQVYCEFEDFQLAREVCDSEPNLRDPSRRRITVG